MQLTRWAAAALAATAACSDPPAVEIDAAPPDAAIDAGIDAPGLCDDETRDDDYVPGMSRTGANGYTVVLVNSSPAPESRGNYTWQLRVLDPSQSPRDGLDVRVFPFMPDHGHGTSAATVTAGTAGTYTIGAISLYMTGYWTIRIGLRASDAEVDFVVYKFCVD